MQELKFFHDGILKNVKWAHLKVLYDIEKQNIYKLSNFNEVAVYSKPIERQNMSICFNIFLEEMMRV